MTDDISALVAELRAGAGDAPYDATWEVDLFTRAADAIEAQAKEIAGLRSHERGLVAQVNSYQARAEEAERKLQDRIAQHAEESNRSREAEETRALFAAAALSKVEQDERIEAWMTIADHPAFRTAYSHAGTLIEGFMDRLDALARAENAERELRDRELHHFEEEQECDAAHAVIAEALAALEQDGDFYFAVHRILSAVPSEVLRERDERVKAEALRAMARDLRDLHGEYTASVEVDLRADRIEGNKTDGA